jgi:anaerobic selenocysteine-containing dehydrogenase
MAKYATHHLQLRPGTNVPLLNMMLYYIISENLLEDATFITSRTEGYEEFLRRQILSLNIDNLEKTVSGVPSEQVRAAAITYASAEGAMSFHGLGVTEHSQGTLHRHAYRRPRYGDRQCRHGAAWASIRCAGKTTCKVCRRHGHASPTRAPATSM